VDLWFPVSQFFFSPEASPFVFSSSQHPSVVHRDRPLRGTPSFCSHVPLVSVLPPIFVGLTLLFQLFSPPFFSAFFLKLTACHSLPFDWGFWVFSACWVFPFFFFFCKSLSLFPNFSSDALKFRVVGPRQVCPVHFCAFALDALRPWDPPGGDQLLFPPVPFSVFFDSHLPFQAWFKLAVWARLRSLLSSKKSFLTVWHRRPRGGPLLFSPVVPFALPLSVLKLTFGLGPEDSRHNASRGPILRCWKLSSFFVLLYFLWWFGSLPLPPPFPSPLKPRSLSRGFPRKFHSAGLIFWFFFSLRCKTSVEPSGYNRFPFPLSFDCTHPLEEGAEGKTTVCRWRSLFEQVFFKIFCFRNVPEFFCSLLFWLSSCVVRGRVVPTFGALGIGEVFFPDYPSRNQFSLLAFSSSPFPRQKVG